MTRSDFNNLVSNLSRKLFGYAFQILRNREEAEDAVQEVFIRLWNMGRKLEEYSSIEALSVTITKNYCIDLVRKHKYFYDADTTGQDHSLATEPSPHEQMERNETKEILNSIIEQLPEASRNLIQMREIEGLSYEEIGEKTDQNINTLRVNLSRARKIVRDEYIKYQNETRGTR
jgi:RNA polymerase sigma factor (sigma-70 family)